MVVQLGGQQAVDPGLGLLQQPLLKGVGVILRGK
jgi:hypothetical protein